MKNRPGFSWFGKARRIPLQTKAGLDRKDKSRAGTLLAGVVSKAICCRRPGRIQRQQRSRNGENWELAIKLLPAST
jgi:hypothetical protein